MHSVLGRTVHGVNRIGRVHGLWGRHVFYSNWSNLVQQLWSRDVFYNTRGLSNFDMLHLSVKLQVTCGELSFGELHLQRGLFWARWRHVHSVRGRKVQDWQGNSISNSDVLWRLSVPTVHRQIFRYNLRRDVLH
jgi:hypothetical protein